MIFYGFLLVLLVRPSFGLLNWFTLIFSILYAAARALTFAPPVWESAGRIAGETAGNALIFYLVGAIIVTVRGDKSKQRSDKQLDKEMERIRAEIAARDAQPPAAQ